MRNGAITGAISVSVPMIISSMKPPPLPPLPERTRGIPIEQTPPPTIKGLLEGPKYEFGKNNGAEHWLKHTQGFEVVNG